MYNQSTDPNDQDIWRAALLYVGLYGDEAMEYAYDQCSQEYSLDKQETWERIMSKISELLDSDPSRTIQ
jgi:hypothetical protein